MKASVCPICKGRREPYSKNPSFPFCGPRCKLADLSNWLGERYSVPAELAPESEDDASSDPEIVH